MKNFEVRIYSPANLNERWYVYLYNTDQQKIIQKFYKGINKEDRFENRMLRCEVLKESIEKELKSGWIPGEKKDSLPQPYQNNLSIPEAYQLAFDILNASKKEDKTKVDYKSHKGKFLEAVIALNWTKFLFTDLDQFHFKLIIDKIVEINGHGNSYFNKHLNLCKSFNTVLKNSYIIKESKVHGISEMEYKTPERHILTKEEQTTVVRHFQKVCPQFITKLKTLYHLDLRPKEIRLLKVGMIDQKLWYFRIPEEITKNDKKAFLLIPDDLKADLQKLDLSNPDYYLFGIEKTRSRDRNKIFKPSPNIISKNAANNLWRKEVKIALGIESNMYDLKKKNNNDKLELGWLIDEVKEANRHSTIEMTKIYATKYNQIVQEKHRDNYGTFD